jgi:uncharacterized repeat protein (TIGR03803 family)
MTKLEGWRIGFVVFMLFAATAIASPAQTFTTLASFDGIDGAFPLAGLVQGRDGNYYGITANGGTNRSVCVNDCGTVFKITPAGTLTTLYSFCAQTGCPDGSLPYAGLVQGTDGSFYGTTAYGGNGGNSKSCGDYGCGTIFRITPAGTLTTLYRFCAQTGCPDGSYPNGLVQGADGNFYGTTYYGGTRNNGTVFKITPSGTLTTLHNLFRNGKGPSGLIQASDGNFYGMTSGSPTKYPNGSVFKITRRGKLTTLTNFTCTQTGCAYGSYPSGLVQGTDGNFYGTTASGGAYYNGTVFKITPSGTLTTLYSFCAQTGCPDGNDPNGLLQAADGNFYGTTNGGGTGCSFTGPCGTVFKITPSGTLTTLYSFCTQTGCPDGSGPNGLLQATDGNFYGTTASGGASGTCGGCGTIFGLATGLGPFVSFVRGSGKVGAKAEILGQGFTGTSAVSFNGTAAHFVVHSDTYLMATVPQGATTGYVTVTTPGGTLQSNLVFRVTK